MNQKEINNAVDYLYTHGQKYAQAKAEVTYIEEFRKSKKAMLMKTAMENGCKSAAAAEIEAYSDPSYIELLKGLKAAVEASEGMRWGLIAAQARIECWRSMEASNRVMDRAVS
jgi:hypothetical protein